MKHKQQLTSEEEMRRVKAVLLGVDPTNKNKIYIDSKKYSLSAQRRAEISALEEEDAEIQARLRALEERG